MLRNLTFFVQFAYFNIRLKKCFVISSNFSATLVTKSNFKWFCEKRLTNVLRYSWKHFGKSRATCGKPYFGSRSLVKSVKTRQSISQLARAFFKQSERYWVWQRGQFLLFSHINTRYTVDSAWRVILFPGATFLHINGA